MSRGPLLAVVLELNTPVLSMFCRDTAYSRPSASCSAAARAWWIPLAVDRPKQKRALS